MNDFDWDVLQKKRIAHSAAKKKGNRKGCRLPCDNLTQKQIEKKHGEVYTMNINEPMTYDEWRALPVDMRVTYYNSLVERFGVGPYRIAEMMGANPKSFAVIVSKLPGKAKVDRTIFAEREQDWWEFCGIEPFEDEEEDEGPIAISSINITFDQIDQLSDVIDFLEGLQFPENARVTISVEGKA